MTILYFLSFCDGSSRFELENDIVCFIQNNRKCRSSQIVDDGDSFNFVNLTILF